MECRSILSLISEYIDEELSEGMRSILEEHIYRCKRCTIILNTTKTTIRIVRTRRRQLPSERMRELIDSILLKIFS